MLKKIKWTSISQAILKTSIPLILSTLSYPLFSFLSFFIINIYFPNDIHNYILAQSILIIFIRGSESLLSGTRVLSAQNITAEKKEKSKILHFSIASSIWLATLGVAFVLIIKFISSFGFINETFSTTLVILSIGLYGHFLFNSTCYYAHGNQSTLFIPIASWFSNAFGLIIMLISAHYFKSSYLCIIFLYTLSRCILGFLAYSLIPASLKTPFVWTSLLRFDKIFESTKIGLSYFIYSLVITGTYFIFTLSLKYYAPNDLINYQTLMNILNILSTINVPIASSGAIILVNYKNDITPIRTKILNTTISLNMCVTMFVIFIFYVLSETNLFFLGQKYLNIDFLTISSLFCLLIYFFELFQIIMTQTMTYHKDYLFPPIVRGLIFSTISLSIFQLFLLNKGQIGVLCAILTGTLTSFTWILIRFKKSQPALFTLFRKRKPHGY